MATGIVKTFTDSVSKYVSSQGITIELNFQLTMTQTYDEGSGKSNLIFSDFKMSYSCGNYIIGDWTGLADGVITVTVNGVTHTIYNEIWSSTYINKYNCKMQKDTYNPVKLVDDDTPWTYTLSDLTHADDGSLSVDVAWEKVTNVTNAKGWGLLIAGEETVALTENLPVLSTWLKKFAYINNNAYRGYIYQNGKFKKIKFFILTDSSEINSIIGIALAGKAIVGQGG